MLPIFTFLWMSCVVAAAFLITPKIQGLGHLAKIIYFHVPYAWVGCLSFAFSVFYSIKYLKKRSEIDDIKSACACEIGLVFTFIATITGAVFAKFTWGVFWNWDPRQTTVFIIFLVYLAYFALRQAIPDEERRYTLSAVYSLVAFSTMPFLFFILPRTIDSLHPKDSVFNMDSSVTILLLSSASGFTILFLWIFKILVEVQHLVRKEDSYLHE